jgi:nicotinamidase/pyrazinamidase
MRTLILIDIQYDFLPGGALAVPEGDQILPKANEIQKFFPLVVATQDWHPQNHGSFASNHPGRNPFDMGKLGGIDQVLWPDHCVQQSKGADFAETLDTSKIETIFRKGMAADIDSYSGFFDNGRQKSTGMSEYLKGRGVKEVFIAGLAADYCVGFTALDAIDEGFETTVVEDATKAIDPAGWEKMKAEIISRGGRVIHSSEI